MSNTPKILSIIIPCFNESKTIKNLIDQISQANSLGLKKEIIIVDDGSDDDTPEILKKIEKKYLGNTASKSIILRAIYKKKNQGKGSALKKGFEKASGDILLIQDADLEYSPKDYPKILKPILENKAKVVYGSRHLSKNQYFSLFYYLGGLFLDKTISFILRTNLTDAITGSKTMTREVYDKIKPLETDDFGIEVELTAKIVKHGYKPYEVAASYKPRGHEEGKNIRWHHGFTILRTLLKYSR
ncbi:MAG: glycosyltransferase family 2 protein [Patescibacteria group bacterium]